MGEFIMIFMGVSIAAIFAYMAWEVTYHNR